MASPGSAGGPAMSFAVLFTAAAILVPAPTVKEEGWTGQMVMLKKSNVPYRLMESSEVAGTLMMIEYRVIRDKGDTLLVIENGKDAFVNKSDLVLQSDAVGHYSEVIQNQPSDA